jgi:PhzF family phenazine biosynthesis protein
MMKIPLYQIDAFAERPFAGNPAAVCPLGSWLGDDVMQSIAIENNLSETAFLVGGGGAYDLRWFTPAHEVDLCGHATLASAHVVFNTLEPDSQEVRFSTRSGDLFVKRDGARLLMNFPAVESQPAESVAGLAEALGVEIEQTLTSPQYQMIVLASPDMVRNLEPDFSFIAANVQDGELIVTAPGDDCDFVSRFFAPAAGIDEDPVTGSAHCQLVPYWSERLAKKTLLARQVSGRGGTLYCEDAGDRVMLAGSTISFLEGTITL